MKLLCCSKFIFIFLLFSASSFALDENKSAIVYYGKDISYSNIGVHDYIIIEPDNITAWGSDIYPWRIHGGISYLIRYSYGCGGSVWCKYNRFYYFKVRFNTIEYLGTFIQNVDPLPPWWDEAKVGYDAKRRE